jgi:AcrR family transcriptional regulator
VTAARVGSGVPTRGGCLLDSVDATEMTDGLPAKLPAHRPSRRQEIVDAAIKVFARTGFAETSVQDVADEAGVVPTAVYYHFAGKDELFDVVLQAVITELDEVVDRARPEDDHPAVALPQITTAVWNWIESRPDHARILYSHLPGATKQARLLRVQFEEQHIERAFVYARHATAGERRLQSATAAQAATRLAVRTLISTLIAIHPMRLDGGPLSRRSPRALREALDRVVLRMLDLD